ncbi:MAG: hypothetical protein K6T99_01525 [Armatimonadetes bacterium]|nr:hypothetical protein [Armatimonadota bacterium]
MLDLGSGFRRGVIGDARNAMELVLAHVCEFIFRVGSPGENAPSVEINPNNADFLEVRESEGSGLAFFFRHHNPELEIELRVSAGIGPQLSKQLLIKNIEEKSLVLFDAVLDRFEVPEDVNLSGGGRGLPVVIGNSAFTAIEFPESENIIKDSLVSLEYYPASIIKPGETFKTERAIFRLCTREIEAEVLSYIEEVRINKSKHFRCWYSSRGAHECEGPSEHIIAEQLRHVLDLKTNWRIPFEYFILDFSDCDVVPAFSSGDECFPDGLGSTLEKIKNAGLKPGISFDFNHLSEIGDPRDLLLGLVNRGLKFISFHLGSQDNVLSDKYQLNLRARKLIELFSNLKAADPEIIIQVSTSKCSPWWLKFADFVSEDGDGTAEIPAPSLRHSQILHNDLRHCLFKVDSGTYIGYSDRPFWSGKQFWKRDLIMSLSRAGRIMLSGELHLLDDNDRLFLQRLVQVRSAHRASIGLLQRVIGKPELGKVYGFSSAIHGRGLVALYNPSWETKVLELRAEDLHCDPSVRNICVQIFPEHAAWAILPGSSFHIHIDPWEVKWLEVEPSDEHIELLEKKFRRTENEQIPVTLVLPPEGVITEITQALEMIDFGTGLAFRCRPELPRAWESFPLMIDISGLKGELYINNHPMGVNGEAGFSILYPWTRDYSYIDFGKQNLVYLATKEGNIKPQSNIKLRLLPYYSSSACREDWPHSTDCSMVIIIRYFEDEKPFRPSLDPRIAQCAIWLDGVWMEPYRVPPLIPRVRSGFSWAVFILDLEGDWECVRILVPKIVNCEYNVEFFLTDKLKAATFAQGE